MARQTYRRFIKGRSQKLAYILIQSVLNMHGYQIPQKQGFFWICPLEELGAALSRC